MKLFDNACKSSALKRTNSSAQLTRAYVLSIIDKQIRFRRLIKVHKTDKFLQKIIISQRFLTLRLQFE